jgi:hypothetical protein
MQHVFRSFLKTGLEQKEFCIYAFPEKAKPHLSSILKNYVKEGQLHILGIKGEKIGEIRNEIEKMYYTRGEQTLRLLIDFGDFVNQDNINQVINFEKRMRLKNITEASAFNLESQDNETAGALIKLHDKVVICTQKETTLYFSSSGNFTSPSIEMMSLSQDTIEQFVKKNIETIILSMLQKEPMRGYDVIKDIFRRFDVLLS